MEDNHSFLRFCDNHWKSEQVFITYYPAWHDNNVKKPGEVIDVDAETDSKDEAGPSKRPRSDHSESTPPSPAPTQVTTKRARVRVPVFVSYMHY
jgi:hypothetical protein